MTQHAELLQMINTLPPEYFGEVIDFVEYLQNKTRKETVSVEKAEGVAEREPSYSADQKPEVLEPWVEKRAKEFDERIKGWTKWYSPETLEEFSRMPPILKALSGIANVGDKTYEQLRDERLTEKYGI